MLVERWTSAQASVRVAAADPELLEKVVADVRSRAPVVERRPETVAVDFWYQGQCRPTTVRRRLDVPSWDAIAPNYTAGVRRRLDALMTMSPPESGGRLLLGTALRARARRPPSAPWLVAGRPGARRSTWSTRSSSSAAPGTCSRCCWSRRDGDDDDGPGEGDGAGDGDGAAPRWRLLVLEDADELLRADAKRETGQALSRLLNVADGFLGQGVRVLAPDHHQRAARTAAPGRDPARPVPGRGRVHPADGGRERRLPRPRARTGAGRADPGRAVRAPRRRRPHRHCGPDRPAPGQYL